MAKQRPILMSGPMVRALLAGTKTQTRRMVKGLPEEATDLEIDVFEPACYDKNGEMHPGPATFGAISTSAAWCVRCPYGQPGDQLWVRETCRFNDFRGSVGMMHGRQKPWQYQPHDTQKSLPGDYEYRADEKYPQQTRGWTPSIHMPRAASRLLLEITSVRVERVQDISEADAVAEGIRQTEDWGGDWVWYQDYLSQSNQLQARESYASLWASINGPDSWAANPWVWVVAFKVVKGGPDAA